MTFLTYDHNISAFPESILKSNMRFGKNFSRALIWDQPQLSSSIRLEVTAQQRQRLNTIFFLFLEKKDPSHLWPQYLSFSWIDFQK